MLVVHKNNVSSFRTICTIDFELETTPVLKKLFREKRVSNVVILISDTELRMPDS